MSYRNDTSVPYDLSILSGIPDPTRAGNQEDYGVGLLDERRAPIPPAPDHLPTHQPPLTDGYNPGTVALAHKEGQLENGAVAKVAWYRTRWGITVIVIVLVIGGIVGGVVGGTHHSSHKSNGGNGGVGNGNPNSNSSIIGGNSPSSPSSSSSTSVPDSAGTPTSVPDSAVTPTSVPDSAVTPTSVTLRLSGSGNGSRSLPSQSLYPVPGLSVAG